MGTIAYVASTAASLNPGYSLGGAPVPGDPSGPIGEGSTAAGGGFWFIFLLMMVLALGSFVLWVWSIIDAAKRDDAEWAEAGKSKVTWIVLLALLGSLASLIYLLAARPALKDAASLLRSRTVGGFTPPAGYGQSPYPSRVAYAPSGPAPGYPTHAENPTREAFPSDGYPPSRQPGPSDPQPMTYTGPPVDPTTPPVPPRD